MSIQSNELNLTSEGGRRPAGPWALKILNYYKKKDAVYYCCLFLAANIQIFSLKESDRYATCLFKFPKDYFFCPVTDVVKRKKKILTSSIGSNVSSNVNSSYTFFVRMLKFLSRILFFSNFRIALQLIVLALLTESS